MSFANEQTAVHNNQAIVGRPTSPAASRSPSIVVLKYAIKNLPAIVGESRKKRGEKTMPENRNPVLIALGLVLWLIFLIDAGPLSAQDNETTMKGTLENIKVHGKSLEGNLEGNSPDRDVFVYLPPSYGTDKNRRYPVVYDLHGYTLSAKWWIDFLNWPERPDNAFTSGGLSEMILVAPDAKTLHNGSMYSNSVTTGDWEGFISKDLVEYIDSHYRTLADRMSRGLTGHSMGGYGTVRIGMKHPEVFSSIYVRSSCCLPPRTVEGMDMTKIEAIKTIEESTKGDFRVRSTFSVASAWSPNPKNPPFFVDLPTKNGEVQPMVIAKWAANSPLTMIHQYIPNVKQLHAIALDIGTEDPGLASNTELHQILSDYNIEHTFEAYEGDHMNRISDRFETKVLPFFAKNLHF